MQQTVRVTGKRLTLYAAIAANLAIATTKFIAAVATQSGALFSEGLHSLVDTGDGLLLLLGLHLSHRPATPRHPYGHGLEVYFWSMVVAMAIEPRTMHFGPDLVHVDLDVHIDPSISGRELLDRAQRIENAVRERHPSVRRVSFRFAELSSR